MVKYFRTLLKLIRFFFQDDFLFLNLQKDNFYYPAVIVNRQLLKKHLSKPFEVTRTLELNSDYAYSFQKWVLLSYNSSCNPEKVMKDALTDRLWSLGVKAQSVSFNNGVISSFTYTYI